MRKKASDHKKIKIITIIAGITCVMFLAVYFLVRYIDDRKTVEVVPVSQVSTFYWGDTTNATGTVTNDLVQEIYPDNEKVLSNIFVSQGQPVSIGDPILQYDQEWLELDVEIKTVALEEKDYQIEAAQQQLLKLQNTTVSSSSASSRSSSATPTPKTATATPKSSSSATSTPTPSSSSSPTPSPTPIPEATVTVYTVIEANAVPYKGTGTAEDPYVFLCEPSYTIDPSFTRQIYAVDPYYTDPNDLSTGIYAPFVATFEVREGNSEQGELLHSYTINGIDFSFEIIDGETEDTGATNTAAQAHIDSLKHSLLLDQSESLTYTLLDTATTRPRSTATPTPSNSTDSDDSSSSSNSSSSSGSSSSSNASNYNDMGYTSSELKELISEKKDEIATYQAERKQLQIDLDKASLALENSTVLSTVNGIVQTLTTEDEANENNAPFIVISGSSEYYLRTALPETLLGKIFVGDVLTATSWETSMSYTCEIVSIDDNPLTDDSTYFYGENPNSSQYECLAVIYNSSDLNTGMYLDVTLTTDAADENTLYIEKMYVREDAGGSYVYKRSSSDGRLVKQYVNVGKTLYNHYVAILTDLTIDDYIAFPYGTDVKPRVRTTLNGEESFGDETGGEEDSATAMAPEGSEWLDDGTNESYYEDEYGDAEIAPSTDEEIQTVDMLWKGGSP